MKKVKVLSIILITLMLFSVGAMGFSHYYPREDKKYLSSIKPQINNFLYEYNDFNDELPVKFDNEDGRYTDNPTYINKSEALEDIEYLFSLLKYGYAGYEYFGGDDVFSPAKDNMIWSVRVINGDKIDLSNFLDIIYRELDFIQDAHFSIGSYTLCEDTKYYSSRKFTFLRDANGYYTYIDDNLYYLKEVNDELP